MNKPAHTTASTRMGLSDRYILYISILFSAIILVNAGLYYMFTGKNVREMEGVVLTMTSQVQGDTVRLVMEGLPPQSLVRGDVLAQAVKEQCTRTGGVLHAIIFSHTADDNFFRVVDTVSMDGSSIITLPQKNTVVTEEKEISSLRRGLGGVIRESVIYQENGIKWQNVYHPVNIGTTPGVIQFMMSADTANAAMDIFRDNLRTTVTWHSIISLIIVILVIGGSLVLRHNYTLLIHNLSRTLQEAGGGNLGINLRPVHDDELDELAHSFNTLIEGLRERESREKELEQKLSETIGGGRQEEKVETTEDILETIFRTGVQAMKDQDLSGAVCLFRTLTILKPSGFGSHFNCGVAYAKMGDYDSSLTMFRRAAELNPDHAMTQQYLEKVIALKERDGQQQ